MPQQFSWKNTQNAQKIQNYQKDIFKKVSKNTQKFDNLPKITQKCQKNQQFTKNDQNKYPKKSKIISKKARKFDN